MPKFFVNQENIENQKIIITGEDVNHIKNVLRKNLNDTLEICNAQNGENFLCKIKEMQKETITCEIIEKIESASEPNTYVHIYPCICMYVQAYMKHYLLCRDYTGDR